MDPVEKLLGELAQRMGPRVAVIISQLDTTGGAIAATAANIDRIAAIMAEVRASMMDAEYIEAVAKFVNTFDGIGAGVATTMRRFGVVDTDLIQAVTRQYKLMTAQGMLSPAAFEAVAAPLADTLMGAVTSGMQMRTLMARTYNIVQTVRDISMAVGAEQQLERTLTVTAADEVGADFFLYQGGAIETTRDWCAEREGHVYHREEINQWGRDAAAGEKWSGQVKGTNESTIWVYLGGWYDKRKVCRHTLVPVPWYDVPENDRERMIKKGLVDPEGKSLHLAR